MDKPIEIDVSDLTLDDLILIEDASQGITEVGAARAVRGLLGRLVKNMTEEEIGQLTLPELAELVNMIGAEAKEASVPKETGSGSKTS